MKTRSTSPATLCLPRESDFTHVPDDKYKLHGISRGHSCFTPCDSPNPRRNENSPCTTVFFSVFDTFEPAPDAERNYIDSNKLVVRSIVRSIRRLKFESVRNVTCTDENLILHFIGAGDEIRYATSRLPVDD